MYTDLKREVVETLTRAVDRNPAEGLLLSGGLDSSILAALSTSIKYFSTSLEGNGSDRTAISRVARHTGNSWTSVTVDEETVISRGLKEVVKIRQTFDPGVLNDLPLFYSLRAARSHGLDSAMTGDGADCLFAGYSFMYQIDPEKLNYYIEKRLVPNIFCPSTQIAESLGIKVLHPYLDQEVIDLALRIPAHMKVQRRKVGKLGDEFIGISGNEDKFSNEDGELWGKIILREAFEGSLPKKTLWRPKADLMVGSGMYKLETVIAATIGDSELEDRRSQHAINWWDPLTGRKGEDLQNFRKLQLFLYEIFLDEVGKVSEPTVDQRECDFCFAGVEQDSYHCYTCGGSLTPATPKEYFLRDYLPRL